MGSQNFEDVFSTTNMLAERNLSILGMEFNTLTIITMFLFMAAVGKSAQLGLHVWLPDAMEGPTPVSALIHAATMVTAGVFLVVRCSPIFEYSQFAMNLVAITGMVTALFAASIALVQNDIKKIIAYSTCSQLGYMFFAAGVGAYNVAMFHLFTHAFFKALLFLGSGSVIHAFKDEQNINNMGGVWRKLPYTYALMIIGTLALTGFPLLSGFYSKDAIIEFAYLSGSTTGYYAAGIGIFTAFLTSIYSWRLMFKTFHGQYNNKEIKIDETHESPLIMLIPLIILSIGAIFAGWFGYQSFVGYDMSYFWGDSLFILPEHHAMEEAHHVAEWVKRLPVILAASGVGLAIIAYLIIPSLPARVVSMARPIHSLFFNKWFFDELYDLLFVRSSVRVGRFLWVKGDEQTIDRFGPDGLSELVLNGSNKLSKLQSGYVYHYAFAMMIGVVMLLSLYFSGFGR